MDGQKKNRGGGGRGGGHDGYRGGGHDGHRGGSRGGHDDQGRGRGGRGRGHGGRGHGGRGRGGGKGPSTQLSLYQKEYIDQCQKMFSISTDSDKKYCYTSSNKEKVNLSSEMANCVNFTKIFKGLQDPGKKKFDPKKCEINISKLSSIGCARDMHKKGIKSIVVMNFASPFAPGGFYKKGFITQETSIVSQTLLFASLLSQSAKPYYFKKEDGEKYNFLNNGLIFSPHVPVIADGESRVKEAKEKGDGNEDYKLKEKLILYSPEDVFYIDVVSVSSVNPMLLSKQRQGQHQPRGRGGHHHIGGHDDNHKQKGQYNDHKQKGQYNDHKQKGHDDDDDDDHKPKGQYKDHKQKGHDDDDDHKPKGQYKDHKQKGQYNDHKQKGHNDDDDKQKGHDDLDKIKSSMEKKIRDTIYIAASSKADALVLGAFGCGRSGLSPGVISKIFKKILIDEGYGSYFKRIDFPIQGDAKLILNFTKNLKNSQNKDDSNNEDENEEDENDASNNEIEDDEEEFEEACEEDNDESNGGGEEDDDDENNNSNNEYDE